VIVNGDVPNAGVKSMEVQRIEPAPSAVPDAYSRDALHGTLTHDGRHWVLHPTPLPLDVSDIQADVATLTNQRVSVDPGRTRRLPLPVRSVEPLTSQSFFGSCRWASRRAYTSKSTAARTS
jgi:hypothetical protein